MFFVFGVSVMFVIEVGGVLKMEVELFLIDFFLFLLLFGVRIHTIFIFFWISSVGRV